MRCPVCHHDASAPRCAQCRRPIPEDTSGPVLRLTDITVDYGGGATAVHALQGVDLSVERGEVVLVVGPSGGGKTTALLVMGLLLTPDGGTVQICGHDAGRLSERRRAELRLARLGYLFQDYNLLQSLTSVENVALPLRYAGVRKPAAIARARQLLHELDLGHRAHHRPAALSGGEKQRVAAARALAMGPDVILADEPTANLDSATGKKVSAQLASAAKAQDSAVVIVTHDARLEDIADRVLHLEDGRLLAATA
ncbi:ABC transporter ATP-binding protein [Mycobacterium kansasii]|uniref:Macrolide export ATP-binding/permease protein MacB n=3 Tax=Mycobacterium kansasii TaxID=1768 RepID=A0A653ETD4_MYCKA|nr:ABC transporter [Mycobacterium kansasii]MXO39851.1 ABC transporter ATP-binding protein [Mycobacterium kansasii]POX68984.1 ABC transporter ATP-binding protein [Mycobacterium kansasii]POX69332.1 ABC transporter ATP-binding protein [Mycobacterium kansasii]POX83885.1 ABC transporter ATP-binding protein [Mycobacterium kansasii]